MQIFDEGEWNRGWTLTENALSHPCPENSGVVLHLARVNEYSGLRVVAEAMWKPYGNSDKFPWPRES
jgi:hypothetical protein